MAGDVTPVGQSTTEDLPTLDWKRVRLVTRVYPDYYTWVAAEARRRNISLSELLMQLVDKERGFVAPSQGVLDVAV